MAEIRTDGILTLGIGFVLRRPECLIVCGGAHMNKATRGMIETCSGLHLVSTYKLGSGGYAIGAQGFVYLDYRYPVGLAITCPATIGISEPMSGSFLTNPDATESRMVAT